MNMSEEFTFKFGDKHELRLKNPHGVFTPTGTTSALVKAAANYIKQPGKFLDLGCGTGVAGIADFMILLRGQPDSCRYESGRSAI